MCIRGDIIFIYKLLCYAFKADSDKLLSVHWRGQVKIADVENYKARMAAGEDAVDNKFDNFERVCWCADVPGVTATV